VGDKGVYEIITSQWILKKLCVRVWTGFIWQGTDISGGLLCKRQLIFGSHKRRRTFWPDK